MNSQLAADPKSTSVVWSTYRNATGISECCLVLNIGPHRLFRDTLEALHHGLCDAYRSLDLTPQSHVFTRMFFSDIRNQLEPLRSSEAFRLLAHGACSFIQQPPLEGHDLSLLSYHVTGPWSALRRNGQPDDAQDVSSIHGRHYGLHFACNITDERHLLSFEQTHGIFRKYTDWLAERAMTVRDNVARTWLFVNDIDNHYAGLVDARREFFEQSGLTAQTHYVASTGIEGQSDRPGAVVSMDALAIENVAPAQMTYLAALDHLNPTHEYGVTFERGARIAFGDRAHYHISGTASIDSHGDVLHRGDAVGQTRRTIENINALLAADGLTVSDMAYVIVYVRNAAHFGYVKDCLDHLLDASLPRIYVRASVCRPAWLVEIEAFGVKDCSTTFPPFL